VQTLGPLAAFSLWLRHGLSKAFKVYKLFDRCCQSSLHKGQRNDHGHFHDGRKVLAEVLKWRALLHQAILPVDWITGPLLHFIEQRLRQSDRDQRASTSETYGHVMQILRDAEQNTQSAAEEMAAQEPHIQSSEVSVADLTAMELPYFGMEDLCDTSFHFCDSAIGMSSTADLSSWEDETSLYAKMVQKNKTP
jgi:hypothetical protein